MSIRNLFHNIKMTFVRCFEKSLPYVPSEKRYGNDGENEFENLINTALPGGRIKRNVIINTDAGNAEIDFLILYCNKLFAIEVKNWKGRLSETEEGFIQEKEDPWTGDVNIKTLKSPFGQLKRAVYLLKKQIPCAAWVNNLIFFEGNDDGINIDPSTENIWFDDIGHLIRYIKNEGKSSNAANAENFFDKCIPADCLYSKNWDKVLHCVIDDNSLRFQTKTGEINRKQIIDISIVHHLYYDELNITLHNGAREIIVQENAQINVYDNGMREFALCKIDYIELGRGKLCGERTEK